MQEEQDNTKRSRTTQGTGPNPNTGHHNTPPAIQRGTPSKQQRGTPTPKGDTNTRREGQCNSTALPHPCHPPPQQHPTIHNAPTHHPRRGRVDKGYPTTQRPRRDSHPQCAAHPASNSARHDSSTRQHCSGMSRARATPLHWGGTAAAHTTAIPHTKKGGHHPLIHSSTLTLFTFTHSTNDHDQQSMIND